MLQDNCSLSRMPGVGIVLSGRERRESKRGILELGRDDPPAAEQD